MLNEFNKPDTSRAKVVSAEINSENNPATSSKYLVGGRLRVQHFSPFSLDVVKIDKPKNRAQLIDAFKNEECFYVFNNYDDALRALKYLTERHCSYVSTPAVFELAKDDINLSKAADYEFSGGEFSYVVFNDGRYISSQEVDGKCELACKEEEVKAKFLQMNELGTVYNNITTATYLYKGLPIKYDTINYHKCPGVNVLKKYEPKYDGLAKVYDSPIPFQDTLALLTFKRKIFANTRAWLAGEGYLFADTRALLQRGLFANTRNTIRRQVEVEPDNSCKMV